MQPVHRYNDETILMHDFHSGDVMAFKFVYESLYHSMLNHIIYFVKDEVVAEDIIQDAFIVLWKKKDELPTLKSVASYLYTVAKNASFVHLRRVKIVSRNGKELQYLADMSEPDFIVKAMRHDLIQLSLIAASSLPKKTKQVFELMYIDGLTTTEIAEKLGTTVTTVRSQKASAIAKIRDSLIKQGLLSALVALAYFEASQN